MAYLPTAQQCEHALWPLVGIKTLPFLIHNVIDITNSRLTSLTDAAGHCGSYLRVRGKTDEIMTGD